MNNKNFPIAKTLLCVAVLVVTNIGDPANGQTHKLRHQGRTLVEAEHYSKASIQYPYAEPSEICSGKRNLGYYWGNSWFELVVEVPQMLNFGVTLRASSPKGTQVEVQLVDQSGEMRTLATIDVPKTDDFSNYLDTQEVTLALPAGSQTIRFYNTDEGANIDYITWLAGSKDDVVSVRPPPNAGPVINPLKGFSTGWWRDDEYASVGFQYIEWGKFEPEDDQFDWEYTEEVLNRAGTKGRHFILQFVVDWDERNPVEDNYLGPQWLLDRVGEQRGNVEPGNSDSREIRATKYNDPEFVKEATEAIETLLEHYKDDPRNFVVQSGLLGFWGEWHTFPRTDWSPSDETKRAILSAYLKGLGNNGLTQVRYPKEPVNVPQQKVGYTNGSATTTEHGYEFGKAIEEGQLWKNGPVGGEWPPNVPEEHWRRFFQTEEGERFLKQARYSTLLPPEPKEILEILPSWKPEDRFLKMHRQMGYNFQVEQVRHLVSGFTAGHTHIEVDLKNVGIAPFYKNWDVQLAILHKKTGAAVVESVAQKRLLNKAVVTLGSDLRKVGPGQSVTFSGSIATTLEEDEDYQIGIRLLQPDADKMKLEAWPLSPRNVYVVLANEVDVIKGKWNKDNELQGGWNVLGDLQRRKPKIQRTHVEGSAFPLEGSFRPKSAQPKKAAPDKRRDK